MTDMPIWPFSRRRVEALTPEELRTKLIAAASGPKRKLRGLCKRYKDQVAANLGLMCKVPDETGKDPASLDGYMQRLVAVAQCLATECNAPELWNKLCGTPDDNPLLRWNRWLAELPGRMDRLEYDDLISEARSFVEQSRTLRGNARQYEAFLLGRLGELLFHSGKVSDAIEPFQAALAVCRDIRDVEGEVAYLNALLEAHRYLGDVAAAMSMGDELIGLHERQGKDAGPLKRRVRLLRDGEPRCRIVCVRDGDEWELDEVPPISEGRYEFQFRRNRLSLRKASALVDQGNALASRGQLADALAKYQEASEVDPHDPDPLYQSGTCLMELGAYAKGREALEEVERLAPGWFHCRSDAWLAESLENGSVSDEEFRLLRALEDGGLDPTEATKLATKAAEASPGFAPFHLVLGDLQRNRGETDSAIASYRTGLELVAEPDLESRLLSALAGLLPAGSPERNALIARALSLEGNLVSQASARLMALQKP